MEYTAEGRSDNALQRVVFIVQFSADFSASDFQNIDAASRSWRQELPRRSVQNAVLLQPRTNRVAFDEEKVIGLSYESLMKDGEVEFGLRFEESRILFLSGKYTAWNDVWPIAEKHLNEAICLVNDAMTVTSFAVEYVDLFRATGSYNDFDSSKILRKDSRFIPNHIFDRSENFHFHTGYFEMIETPAPHRCLTRINADLRDNNDGLPARDLTIVLYHQVLPIPAARGGSDALPKEILNKGLDNFEDLHRLDKSVLAEIINDDMCNQIGLD